MARKPAIEQLIHCDACGEDYSATYKRCPFCGEKISAQPTPSHDDDDDFDDGYVFDGQDAFDEDPPEFHSAQPKGGKRLATGNSGRRSTSSGSRSGGRGAPPPINWPRLITFLCSLVIIIAALIIVFTVLYPQLHKDPAPAGSQSAQPQDSEQLPGSSEDPGPASDAPDVSDQPAVDPNALTGLTFGRPNDSDFTLQAGESHTITLVTDPADWTGEVIWSSSDDTIATVDANGKVTNVNTAGSMRRAIITVTAGGLTLEADVYCRVASSDPSPSPSGGSGGALTPGAKGTITGASSGLRVRSGPGTTYEVLASLVNGSSVTVVSDAGDGWYEITYSGSGGTQATGYIMGEYISVP